MNKNQIGKKYSRALISTMDLQNVPNVIEELIAFSHMLDGNRKLRLLFAGMIFSDEEKDKALGALFPRLKLSSDSEKFLRLIVAQGHITALKEIIVASVNAFNDKKKKATAIVISSVALDRRYTDRLKGALSVMTGKEIDIETEVDPSLLGGFIVKIGSTIYDSSLIGQLRLLRAELMQ